MIPMRDWPAAPRIAGGALMLALLADAFVLVRTREEGMPVPLTIRPVERIAVRPVEDAELVRLGMGSAPFGGTPLVTDASLVASLGVPTAEPERPRLLGTVVEGDGGFVVVESGDARVTVVRIGGRVGDLRLRSVGAGVAVFSDPNDGRITLRTALPGSGPESRP